MTKQRQESHLVALFRRYQDKIANVWAEKVHSLPGTRYNQLPLREIRASTLRGVAVVIEFLATDSWDAMDAYLMDVSAMRLQMEFDISEVIEALSLLKEVAFPIVWRAYPEGATKAYEAVARLDACLRSVIARFSHLYAEAMSRSLRAQQERTALILDAAEAANSTLRLDQVLQRIVEKSKETFGLGCALYLWEVERELLVPQIRSGFQGEDCLNAFSEIELCSASSALLHDMLEHEEPITSYGWPVSAGWSVSAGWPVSADPAAIARALGLESALIVPIVLDSQVFVAVIGGRCLKEPHRFTEADIKLAQGMANAVGLAIKNAQLYERTRQQVAELEGLQRIMTALLQKLTLSEVLEIVCREARQLTGATGCALFSLQDEAWLQLVSSGGSLKPPADCMPLEGTLAGRAVLQGEPLLINDAEALTRTSHPMLGLESLLVIPLRREESIVGVLDVTNKPDGFTQGDVRLLSLFADGAAIAIESTQLQQQAEQLAVVEERQRLARELHDSVTQALYSVTLYAEATRMAMSAGKQDVAVENLRELHRMAREAMIDMRTLIFELHPPALEEEGLVAALQARLAAVEARAGLQTNICVEEAAAVVAKGQLPLSVEEELFWIAVEALNNVVKHADAKQVKVFYRIDTGNVCLEIKDDGVGFDPSEARQSGGMGLRGMEERAQRIQGKLAITSTPGQGTRVSVETEI
jgi:signal transduction histidine kinase